MPAYLRLPKSIHPNAQYPCPGYTSLDHLQSEMASRHKRNHPPAEFDPAWLLEPTICHCILDGVELHKWSNSQGEWLLDAVITWRD